MNFISYIKDRLLYIILYFVSILFTIIIMQLDRIIANQDLNIENICYCLILGFSFISVFLIIDYLRKKKLYDVLNSIKKNNGSLEEIFKAPKLLNSEHRLITNILTESFKSYEDQLSTYKDNQKEHLHFINQWVHQMKTPVSVINLILQSHSDGLDASQAESIGEEVDKLAHGLEMILYNSRVTDFEMDFKVEKVDIASVVRNVINDHKKELIRDSIFPKINVEGDSFVETDAKWIRFVINQIITNSIKYSRTKDKEDKKISINIVDDNGIKLSIKDDGVGMPIEDIPRVFNPFFTGSNGRNFPESTGMGMYLSKLVCNKLGHGLFIDSAKGEWTRVDIKFCATRSLYSMKNMQD